jgi:hypothetical protein
MKKSLTNLEYINSLPCSQRLKDRIIELTKFEDKRDETDILNDEQYKIGISGLFYWADTTEGHNFWDKIDQSIENNTPIVE